MKCIGKQLFLLEPQQDCLNNEKSIDSFQILFCRRRDIKAPPDCPGERSSIYARPYDVGFGSSCFLCEVPCFLIPEIATTQPP